MREQRKSGHRRCWVQQRLTFLLKLSLSYQSLSRVYPIKIPISITPALIMADTEPKAVEEVPAAVEEEAQEPKVGKLDKE